MGDGRHRQSRAECGMGTRLRPPSLPMKSPRAGSSISDTIPSNHSHRSPSPVPFPPSIRNEHRLLWVVAHLLLSAAHSWPSHTRCHPNIPHSPCSILSRRQTSSSCSAPAPSTSCSNDQLSHACFVGRSSSLGSKQQAASCTCPPLDLRQLGMSLHIALQRCCASDFRQEAHKSCLACYSCLLNRCLVGA